LFILIQLYIHLSTDFNFRGSVHRNIILIHIQQDATLHSLFLNFMGPCIVIF